MSQSMNKKFLKLARKLSPEDESLAEELQDVFDNYVKEDVKVEGGFEPGVGYYAVEKEPQSLEEIAWSTLIEGLIEREKLVEIDKRDSPEMVAQEIDQLLSDQPNDSNRWVWANLKERWKEFPHIFLKDVQQRVIGSNKILATLQDDYPTENYLVCLVTITDFAEIEKLLQAIPYGKIEKVVDMKQPQGIH